MTDYTGQQFGQYLLKRKLGGGGFADVYLGEHKELGSQAAIKVLTTNLSSTEIDQFRIEARMLVNLGHPHIIRVLDFAVPVGGVQPPYLVMDYAENGTLAQLQGKTNELRDILPFIQQIAEALDYVHQKGLLHRDIKPENILLDGKNKALLSDFGIAAVQGAHIKSLFGTPDYMALEHLQRHPCQASDQYSLAVVVYELLTNEYPYDGSVTEIMNRQRNGPQPSLRSKVPTIAAEVEQAVLKALAKDPSQRYPTVSAFADALAQAIGWQPASSGHSGGQSGTQGGVSGGTPTIVLFASGGNAVGTNSSGQTIRVARPQVAFRSEATLQDFKGHGRGVNAVGWSPDSQYLISASDDRSVRLWDVAQQSMLYEYRGHRKGVQVVAWSPNDTRVASMDNRQVVHVWDSANGQRSLVYSGHEVEDLSLSCTLAWSPDGNYLATGDEQGKVHVWNARTGDVSSIYREHDGWISALAWSPGGQYIASGSKDKTMQVWEAFSGTQVRRYTGHSGEVCAVAWSPHGNYLAAAANRTVHLWDANQVRLIDLLEHNKGVTSLAWSPDERFLAAADRDKLVVIWEISTRKTTYVYREHAAPVCTVAWAPDGKKLVSGDEDGMIYLWIIK
ncbi:MAG TPA: serine/threonine-protein kinase [Ktedonobacteraceae bacterium]|jgi:WD40 repeat protein|nr:serine/threonine-protein kinase [Ktedonobacteraceae bacterium]